MKTSDKIMKKQKTFRSYIKENIADNDELFLVYDVDSQPTLIGIATEKFKALEIANNIMGLSIDVENGRSDVVVKKALANERLNELKLQEVFNTKNKKDKEVYLMFVNEI